ncbi:MAG: carbon monoxide dehydrogenase [Candidatus Omnitrophica bacterium CG11_big_fil_rev_8_21_14_0_20_42_13]|uniref:Carbon monoxide dehydrogenase n=1 Tax=Candidatus Ghiorseimicrobium undicola TaxID=1974746 RepID=A0A2H0LXG7_9BACT|nr:MAG: carbon monoxide dehydrogenase [Candidatus Omnitrophica bacterium CG11_big_fil_rev_8_21_14_0_20_42_13]
MKIGIAGKGGVGKTTLAALICWALKDAGLDVLAVDADPDANLGSALGFPKAQEITPIVEMKELIHERMGVSEDNPGFFKLNPKIDDIPDRFLKVHGGIKLIVMGTIKGGNTGCACPENTFLKRLLHQITLRDNEHIVVDFEAGVEHLGRGTADKFDRLIIVVEPSTLSIESAKRIYPLAKDIGIKNISLVANRIASDSDINFIASRLDTAGLLGVVHFSDNCKSANQRGDWESLKKDKVYTEIKEVVEKLLTK